MPSIVYPPLQPLVIPADPAATDLTAAIGDITAFSVPFQCRVLKLLTQVTVTAESTGGVAPVVSVEKRDYDDTANAVEMVTWTLDDAVAAANTIIETAVPVAAASLVAAGQSIVLVHKTQGTAVPGPAAGSARVWVVIQPVAL